MSNPATKRIPSVPELAEIHAMARLELKMSDLYQAFSQTCGGHQKFWDRLAREEQMHSKVLEHLAESYVAGDVTIGRIRLKLPAIEDSCEFIVRHLAMVNSRPLPMTEALALAERIETQTLDALSLKVFDGVSDLGKAKLQLLAEKTGDHLARIQKMRQYLTLPFFRRWFQSPP